MEARRAVRVRFLLIALGAALLLTACDPGEINTAAMDSLLLEFRSNRTRLRAGEPVQMRFTAYNSSYNTIVIESPATPVMEIVIREVNSGREILRWSAQNPDKVLHRAEWRGKETKTLELSWTPKQEDLRVGSYHDVSLSGLLSQNSKVIQGAGVRVCASDVCP